MVAPFTLDEPCQPVSLGNTCEAKLQICRKLNDQAAEPMSDMMLRLFLAPPGRGETVFGRGLFDWQVTPFWSLREYIDRDFHGVFEREDLEPGVEGSVLHRRLRANHLHDFEHLCPDQNMTDAIIDKGYAEARARLDRQAEDFRHLLATPGRFLYVHHCEDIPGRGSVLNAIDLFTVRNPEHRPHFLFYGLKDQDADLSDLEAQGWVTKIYRVAESGKPAGREFEGNDAAWDVGFNRFNLLQPQDWFWRDSFMEGAT